jgi:hypothetical protein
MKTPAWTWITAAILSAALAADAISQSAAGAESASSDVYIQQAHGRVAPGANVQKRAPEVTNNPIQSPTATSTAPATCNAQNASSQACYTATQQARPGR